MLDKFKNILGYLSVAFFQRNKKYFSLCVRGNWISPRIVYSSSGEAVPVDGIISSHGIPVGIEGGREISGEWGSEGREGIIMRSFFRTHYICVSYVITMLSVGAAWQGWFRWLI